MSRDRGPDNARVYVGNLRESVKKEELEVEFSKFGKLNSVWVAFNPPGFAFIEFTNSVDAETACDNLNGTDLLGSKVRVEMARGKSRRGGFRGGGGGRRGGGGGGGFRGGSGRRPPYDRDGGGYSSRGGGGRGPARYDSYGGGSRRGGPGGGGGYRGGGGRDFSRDRGRDSRGRGRGGGRGGGSRYRSRSPVSRGGY